MKKVMVSLPVSIFKEGESFIAFTPALDVSAYGSTIEEAKKDFEKTVDIFFEETERKGSTADVLLSLGWEKQEKGLFPPVEVGHSRRDTPRKAHGLVHRSL